MNKDRKNALELALGFVAADAIEKAVKERQSLLDALSAIEVIARWDCPPSERLNEIRKISLAHLGRISEL